MTEIIDSYYMIEREPEYAEFDFEEVPLRVGDVETSSFFSGKVCVSEDFRLEWIYIGVKLYPHAKPLTIERMLFEGLEDGVKDYIKVQFAEWKTTLQAEVML